jgi:hypothetical protein
MKSPGRCLGLAVQLLVACSSGVPKGAPAVGAAPDPLDGRWESQGPPRAGAAPSLRAASLTLDLWQASGDSLGGRLVSLVSGDMPIDVRGFGGIRGQAAGSRVVLELPQPGTSGVIRIQAERRGDTLQVEHSAIGVDDGPFPPGLLLVRNHALKKS